MAPYLRLSRGPSPARHTLLFTPSSTPISSTIRALLNRYIFAAAVTFTTLIGEALNIVISGIPYASGTTWMQYIVSAYMSLAILAIMIIVAALIIVLRIREPKIPRKPDTVGAVMSYLCASRILDEFEGMEGLDEKTRNQRIRAVGKKYEFTETVRRDSKLAWTVDDAFDRPKF